MNSNAVLSGVFVIALLLTGCSILAPQGPTSDSRFQGVVVQNFEDRPVSLTLAVAGGDRSTQFQVELPANDGDGFPPTEVVAPPTLINETGPITVRVGFNGTTIEQKLSRPDNSPCYVALVTVPIERQHSVPTRTNDVKKDDYTCRRGLGRGRRRPDWHRVQQESVPDGSRIRRRAENE